GSGVGSGEAGVVGTGVGSGVGGALGAGVGTGVAAVVGRGVTTLVGRGVMAGGGGATKGGCVGAAPVATSVADGSSLGSARSVADADGDGVSTITEGRGVNEGTPARMPSPSGDSVGSRAAGP